MTGILLSFLTIFVPILAAGLACGLVAGLIGGAWWQRRRDWRPIPHVPADQAIDALSSSVQCTWCCPAPVGLCSCSVRCGHIRCVHVAGRGWTTRDRDILEGKKLP